MIYDTFDIRVTQCFDWTVADHRQFRPQSPRDPIQVRMRKETAHLPPCLNTSYHEG